jgi:uncharacterized protein YneR
MKLTITPAAAEHFKSEWGFQSGDFVRLFVRYGGHSNVHTSYSMGIDKDVPRSPAITAVADGVTFFVEEDEVWYLNGADLKVDYQGKPGEIVFVTAGS